MYNEERLSLNTTATTTVQVEPAGDMTAQLYSWYKNHCESESGPDNNTMRTTNSKDINTNKLVAYTLLDQVMMSVPREEPAYFMVKCVILHVTRNNAPYTACIMDKCNKKVSVNQNGQYTCDRCATGKVMTKFKNRITLNVIFNFQLNLFLYHLT
jgi:replication factor A1